MGFPIIGDLIDNIGKVVGKAIPDADKRMEVNLAIQQLADQAEARLSNERIAQIEVNREQAKSQSLFVAGARPAAMWVGTFGMACSAIVIPIASWVARVAGYTGDFPVLDNTLILYILGGTLGLSGMRTYEKLKGVATNDLTTGNAPSQAPEKLASLAKKVLPDKAPWA